MRLIQARAREVAGCCHSLVRSRRRPATRSSTRPPSRHSRHPSGRRNSRRRHTSGTPPRSDVPSRPAPPAPPANARGRPHMTSTPSSAVPAVCAATPVSLQMPIPRRQPSTVMALGPSPGVKRAGSSTAQVRLAVRDGGSGAVDTKRRDEPLPIVPDGSPDQRDRAGLRAGIHDRPQGGIGQRDRAGVQLVAGERQLREDHQPRLRLANRFGVRLPVRGHVAGFARGLRGRDEQRSSHDSTVSRHVARTRRPRARAISWRSLR